MCSIKFNSFRRYLVWKGDWNEKTELMEESFGKAKFMAFWLTILILNSFSFCVKIIANIKMVGFKKDFANK